MARRKLDLIEESLNDVEHVRNAVVHRFPDAAQEFIVAETARVLAVYRTHMLGDALDTLSDTVRNYTP